MLKTKLVYFRGKHVIFVHQLIWRTTGATDALLQLTAVARVELDEVPVYMAPHKQSFHAKYADELMQALLKVSEIFVRSVHRRKMLCTCMSMETTGVTLN